MQHSLIASVYDTVTGVLAEAYCVPGVENLFETGKPCDEYYRAMLDAYERLRNRLGCGDDDPDAEIMINAPLSICREVGYEMYRCGMRCVGDAQCQ